MTDFIRKHAAKFEQARSMPRSTSKDLSCWSAKMQDRANKAGYRAFLSVEAEMIVANGTVTPVRVVRVLLKPAQGARVEALRRADARAIQAEDRVESLEDMEACIQGCFNEALELAKAVA